MFHLPCNLTKQQALLLSISIIATGLFFYHSSTILSRFLKFEIIQTSNAFYNESLPLPVIRITLNTERHENSSRPFATIRYTATVDNEALPEWAFNRSSARVDKHLLQDYLDVNIVSARNYEYVKKHGGWPLSVNDCNSGDIAFGNISMDLNLFIPVRIVFWYHSPDEFQNLYKIFRCF